MKKEHTGVYCGKNQLEPESGSVDGKSDKKLKLCVKIRRSIKSLVFSGMCYNHLHQRNDVEDDQFVYDLIEETKKDEEYRDSVLLDELESTLTPHKERKLKYIRDLRMKNDKLREKHAEHIQKIRVNYDERHGEPDEVLQHIRQRNDDMRMRHTKHLNSVREKYDARHPGMEEINSETSGKEK